VLREEPFSSVTLSTIPVSWTNLGLLLGSRYYNPAIKNLNHAKPVEFMDIHLNRIQDLDILMHNKL